MAVLAVYCSPLPDTQPVRRPVAVDIGPFAVREPEHTFVGAELERSEEAGPAGAEYTHKRSVAGRLEDTFGLAGLGTLAGPELCSTQEPLDIGAPVEVGPLLAR